MKKKKNSFIAFPDKGRQSRFMPLKNFVSPPERIWWGVLQQSFRVGVADKIKLCAGAAFL